MSEKLTVEELDEIFDPVYLQKMFKDPDTHELLTENELTDLLLRQSNVSDSPSVTTRLIDGSFIREELQLPERNSEVVSERPLSMKTSHRQMVQDSGDSLDYRIPIKSDYDVLDEIKAYGDTMFHVYDKDNHVVSFIDEDDTIMTWPEVSKMMKYKKSLSNVVTDNGAVIFSAGDNSKSVVKFEVDSDRTIQATAFKDIGVVDSKFSKLTGELLERTSLKKFRAEYAKINSMVSVKPMANNDIKCVSVTDVMLTVKQVNSFDSRMLESVSLPHDVDGQVVEI